METDWLSINDKYKAEVARYLNKSIKWLVLISCLLLLVVQFDLAVYGFYERYDMFHSRIMLGPLLTVLGGGALVTYFYRHLLIPNRFLFCYVGLLTLCWQGYLGGILYVEKNIVRGVIEVVDILILTLSISLFPHRKLTLVIIFTLVFFSCFIHIWSIPEAWVFAYSKMLLFVAVVLSGQKVMETWFIRAIKRDIEKQKLITQFRRMALIDGLTNLSNRRHFDETLALEIRACERNQQPLSLILIDIDHFKLLNDSQGHKAGDEALSALSSVLSHVATRPRDLCARVGGEEFAILLPETNLQGAVEIANRLRSTLSEAALPHPASPLMPYITVSQGVTQWQAALSAEQFLANADTLLYKAKQQGRNRAVAESES